MVEEKSSVYLVIRLLLGIIFIYHGIGKIGSGYDGWIDFMNTKQIHPILSNLAIGVEIIIGLLLILGLMDLYTCIIGIVFMITAIYIAHKNDPILGEKGMSYQIMIILLLVALCFTGFGKYKIL